MLNDQIYRGIRFLGEQLPELLCSCQLVFHRSTVQGLDGFRFDQGMRVGRLGFILKGNNTCYKKTVITGTWRNLQQEWRPGQAHLRRSHFSA